MGMSGPGLTQSNSIASSPKTAGFFNLLDYNPDVYLDISNPIGVTVDGSNNITNIADLSGNGVDYYQTADLNRTWTYTYDDDVNKYIGLGGLKGGFNNSFYLTSADYITTTADTWIFVFKDDPDGDTHAAILSQYGPGLFLFEADNDGPVDVFFVRDTALNSLTVTTPLSGQWGVAVCTRETNKLKMWYNDIIVESLGIYASSPLPPIGATDFYNPVLGAQQDAIGGLLANTFFSGRFGLMAKFNSVLSDQTINIIRRNLAAAWSIDI